MVRFGDNKKAQELLIKVGFTEIQAKTLCSLILDDVIPSEVLEYLNKTIDKVLEEKNDR